MGGRYNRPLFVYNSTISKYKIQYGGFEMNIYIIALVAVSFVVLGIANVYHRVKTGSWK